MVSANNPWAIKTRALDRYRWLLLRERHSWLGSTVRFLRDALHDLLFGVFAYIRLGSSVTAEPCDFLLLQSSPKVIPLQRKKLLIDGLRNRGYHLVELAMQEPSVIISGRMLKRPPQPVPLRYLGLASYAEWLVEHYQPRILLNDRNGSLYAPFLRLSLNARGWLLVHMAHATTLENSRRLGMNDYDYYFIFGRSSLEALQARKLRFGNSTAVLVGSHMIDQSYQLADADPGNKVLLVLGLGPDKEKLAGYQKTYALLRDWAAKHSEYRILVKAHPRSKVPFWKYAERDFPNIEVLQKQYGLAQALARASIVVNIMSNAVIEAALSGRPLLYVNCSNARDIFSQTRFFGEKISTVSALDTAIKAVEENYLKSRQRSSEFAEYHLTSGVRGLEKNIHNLERLLTGLPLDASSESITGSC